MDWKEFFKLNTTKVIIIALIFVLLFFTTPCIDTSIIKGNDCSLLSTNICHSKTTIKLCDPLYKSLLHPCEILYDANPPKILGIFDFYAITGCDITFVNYLRYLVIPINLIISYILTCIIYSTYKKLKK